MGFFPASQGLALVILLLLIQFSYGLDSWQVGNPDAGIDIRTPLDAFQCDPWLIYYRVAPTDYGRSLGVNYDDLALHLTTPDSARTLLVKINIPRGEGVIAWTMNFKAETQFFVNPHGPALPNGDYVKVKLGGGGDACLSYATRTLQDIVTYSPAAFHSVQSKSYEITTRPLWFARQTSPEAGLQTHFAPAGVIVSPGPTSAPVSTPAPQPTSDQPSDSRADLSSSSTSSEEHESTSSQSGNTSKSSSSTATNGPGSSSNNFAQSTGSTESTESITPTSTTTTEEVSPSQSQTAHSSQNKVPIIVGAVVGSVFLMMGLFCCILLARRRRNRLLRETSAPFMQIESQYNTTAAASRASITPHFNASDAGVDLKVPVVPAAREDRYFGSESALTESDYETRTSVSGAPMDLVRALEVVAAHVRSGETAEAGPGGAPPGYTRTVSSRARSRAHSSSRAKGQSVEG